MLFQIDIERTKYQIPVSVFIMLTPLLYSFYFEIVCSTIYVLCLNVLNVQINDLGVSQDLKHYNDTSIISSFMTYKYIGDSRRKFESNKNSCLKRHIHAHIEKRMGVELPGLSLIHI